MSANGWDRVNPWRGLRGLPRQVWVLSLATLVNKAGSMVLAFLVLYLTRQLRFSDGAAANVLLLYGAAALVAAPVAGFPSAPGGPRRSMRGIIVFSWAVTLVLPPAPPMSSA